MISHGFWKAQGLMVAAELGIADHLADGPATVSLLAEKCACDAGALYRLLRALASDGFFEETESGAFRNTDDSEVLRSDHPQSVRALGMMVRRLEYPTWVHLLDSIKTGKTAFNEIHGKGLFDYLAEHPEEADIFDQAMTAVHGQESPAIASAYDFSATTSLMDVGGGNGTMLKVILETHPHLQGILFDLPHVVERARPTLTASPVGQRVAYQPGSFFDPIPGSPDAMIMRQIIHDWTDEPSIQILRNCREAVAPEGKVLVVEQVVPDGNTPHPVKWLDVDMLVYVNGQERTEQEYRQLFEKAGLALERIISAGRFEILEGKPAADG
ncbi:Multifunctional cyclase-dehydratase-3-O-methyl transferase TcmN [Planctomycetes bacterium Pan216]|uniref:Multifunctional cyclase-dehydratase-3-O-methyl transferase TcmN n=2 Tax=Kolteria novifilia TaxID=2527975 RepID=A0A518B7Y3_9BACT|nr:Multifunctional cyclase-dehydratase-3-O-methyl transferase TcmN [Planctomycetes bacterium Pan216]